MKKIIIYTFPLSLMITLLGGCGIFPAKWHEIEMTQKIKQDMLTFNQDKAKKVLHDFVKASNNSRYYSANKYGSAGSGFENLQRDYNVPSLQVNHLQEHAIEDSISFDSTRNCFILKYASGDYTRVEEKYIGYNIIKRTYVPVKGGSSQHVYCLDNFVSAYTLRDREDWGRQWLALHDISCDKYGSNNGYLLLSPRHSKDFDKLLTSFLILCPNLKIKEAAK